jgi:hypothetical protein
LRVEGRELNATNEGRTARPRQEQLE